MTDPPIHVRTIRVEVRRLRERELEVRGHLIDERPQGGPQWFDTTYDTTVHDMTLTLRVRYPDLVITDAGGSMTAHPYTICPDALPPLGRLVGLSVAQGFTRAVNEQLGRHRGCAHLTALVHAMAPVVKQGAGATFREAGPPRAEDDHWFINTCQAWREDGPLVERLKQGDVEGLKALAARPRAPQSDRGQTD